MGVIAAILIIAVIAGLLWFAEGYGCLLALVLIVFVACVIFL